NLHQTRDLRSVNQFNEPNELAFIERPDKFALIKEGYVCGLDRFEVLPIMLEWFPLTDRRFVVDLHNPAHQIVIERNPPKLDACLLSFADHVSGLVVDLVLPPIFVIGDWQHRYAVQLATKIVALFSIADFLQKSEDIGS